jgi:transporter family-2 protein
MRTSDLLASVSFDRWPAIAASITAGILLGVLVRINASLGAQIGTLEATFVIHGIGTIFAAIILVPWLHVTFWRTLVHAPAYEWTGGILSIAMVLLANIVVPVLGMALAVSLFVAGDLVFSSLTDWLGWLGLPQIPLSSRRVVGLILALLGVALVHWG